MIRVIKGTKDILPGETEKWRFLEETAHTVCGLYNVKEIRTPTFESTELFQRGVGETTDVVKKEMYTFIDKGNRSLTLKPEGTAGVVRSYIENGLFNLAQPQKYYYFTTAFRYENTQSGRYREFHQFGVEFIGSDDAGIDAEVISLVNMFLQKAGVKNLSLEINSIGCKSCRTEYNKVLKEYYGQNKDVICPTCTERLNTNPMRLLDCKVDKCREISKNAPRIIDYICDDCETHFKKVKNNLDLYNIPYILNPSIVRGLDYYTRTVFEFVTNSIGAQGTVCGGGRYDGLVEELGGKPAPAVGFALGMERLLMLLENDGVNLLTDNGLDVYVLPIGAECADRASEITDILRKHGYSADTDRLNRSVKAQFKYADKINARYVMIIGGEELNSNTVVLKNLATGEEIRDTLQNVIGEIK